MKGIQRGQAGERETTNGERNGTMRKREREREREQRRVRETNGEKHRRGSRGKREKQEELGHGD